MEDKIISRVLMLPDASVHIMLCDGRSKSPSPKELLSFISNPHQYISEWKSESEKKSRSKSSSCIKGGITLIKVLDDMTVVCLYPQVYNILYSELCSNSDNPINLLKYIEEKENTDSRDFLLKFYYEFTGSLKNSVNPEGLSGSDETVFREMLNELISGIFASDTPRKKVIVNENKVENISPEKVPVEDNNVSPQISMLDSEITPEGMITAPQYASKHNIKMPTMYRYLEDKKDPGCRKNKRAMVYDA